MKTKTIYEEKILKEIQDLPEFMQEKLAKFVHFLKREIIRPEFNEKKATDEFLSVCGMWEDDRTIDEQLLDIYSSRKSTTRTENVF